MIGLIPEPPFDPRSWSGSSARFFRAMQAQGLDSAHEVLLSPVDEALAKARTVAYPVSRWREHYHASVPRFRALTRAAGQIIDREKPDAVLQVGAWFSSGAVADVPCYSYHDGNAALRYRYFDPPVSHRRREAQLAWERQVYERLTGIFVMSRWLADSFVQDFRVPADKVHVVGAGINLDDWPQAVERDFSVPRFLFVGQDFERKGGRYLLEAFSAVRKSIPSATLTIIGPSQVSASDGVIFAGFLSKADPEQRAKLNEHFRAATALILPSIYEPFGIALLEGMAHGLPCIASDRCAMPEIVEHGRSGLVVPSSSSEALAEAMMTLARNPAMCAQFGQRGRERVQQHFTWAAVAARIKQIIQI